MGNINDLNYYIDAIKNRIKKDNDINPSKNLDNSGNYLLLIFSINSKEKKIINSKECLNFNDLIRINLTNYDEKYRFLYLKSINNKIYYSLKINNPKDLRAVVRKLFSALNQLNVENKNVYISCTAWYAYLSDPLVETIPNRKVYDDILEISSERMTCYGRNVDIGFFLSEYNKKDRFIISPDLAYLLTLDERDDEEEEIKPRIKITKYIKDPHFLSGNRYFPIIFYHCSIEKGRDLDKCLEYDEHLECDIANEIYLNAERINSNSGEADSLLKKVLSEWNHFNELNKILEQTKFIEG